MISVVRGRSGKKTAVRLPYAPGNRRLLLGILPRGAEVDFDRERRCWLIERHHTGAAIVGLASTQRIRVVFEPTGSLRCVQACWEGRPEIEHVYKCECACLGENHGSGVPPRGSVEVAMTERVGAVRVVPGQARVFHVGPTAVEGSTAS